MATLCQSKSEEFQHEDSSDDNSSSSSDDGSSSDSDYEEEEPSQNKKGSKDGKCELCGNEGIYARSLCKKCYQGLTPSKKKKNWKPSKKCKSCGIEDKDVYNYYCDDCWINERQEEKEKKLDKSIKKEKKLKKSIKKEKKLDKSIKKEKQSNSEYPIYLDSSDSDNDD